MTGTGAVAFAAPALAASGKETFTGSGAITLAKPSLAATGALSFSGSGGVAIAAPSIRGYQAAPVSSGPPRGSLTMMGLGG